MDIILFIIFCIHNSRIAKRKGYSGGQWVLFTILAGLFAEIVGWIFVTLYFRHGVPFTMEEAMKPTGATYLQTITATLIGVGGMLFVKYKADNLEDKNKSTHWTDRIGKPEEER